MLLHGTPVISILLSVYLTCPCHRKSCASAAAGAICPGSVPVAFPKNCADRDLDARAAKASIRLVADGKVDRKRRKT